jgi:hypothetical protein
VPVASVVRDDPAVRVALVVSESPAVLVVLEDPVVLVALVVSESPVVPESRAVPVALELEIVPVVVLERELVPVAEELVLVPAAELATDQPHGHLAVLARTKSVTTAHRPDLVPLLEAEEDLAAAVAETTREPVAAEAVIAWAAAE